MSSFWGIQADRTRSTKSMLGEKVYEYETAMTSNTDFGVALEDIL